MSQYRVKQMLDPLVRQQQENERRAQRFEERKQFVLHEKTRLMGIDCQALEEQVRNKATRQQLQLERDVYFDESTNKNARTMTHMENIKQEQMRARNVEVDAYRRQQIQERERDDAVKLARDDAFTAKERDPAFLNFQGEDIQKANRTRAQQSQQQDWLNQQVDLLQQSEEEARQQGAAQQREMLSVHAARTERERQQEAERRLLNRQHLTYNQNLAVDQRHVKAIDARRNEEMAQMEVQQQMSSQFLNDANGKPIRNSGFKGFSKAQRDQILEDQRQQVAELQAKRNAEQQLQNAQDQDSENVRRALVRKDRENMNLRKHNNVQLRKEHERQRTEKDLRFNYLEKVVYTNPVGEGYFEQFGQSCR